MSPDPFSPTAPRLRLPGARHPFFAGAGFPAPADPLPPPPALPRPRCPPGERRERIRRCTAAGGIPALPADFAEWKPADRQRWLRGQIPCFDPFWGGRGMAPGDWQSVRSDDPFERLYLDEEDRVEITREQLDKHYRALRTFWDEELAQLLAVSGGTRAEIVERYAGEDGNERVMSRYRDRLDEAYAQLQGLVGVPAKAPPPPEEHPAVAREDPPGTRSPAEAPKPPKAEPPKPEPPARPVVWVVMVLVAGLALAAFARAMIQRPPLEHAGGDGPPMPTALASLDSSSGAPKQEEDPAIRKPPQDADSLKTLITSGQDPSGSGPVPSTVTESHTITDDDEGTLPPPGGEETAPRQRPRPPTPHPQSEDERGKFMEQLGRIDSGLSLAREQRQIKELGMAECSFRIVLIIAESLSGLESAKQVHARVADIQAELADLVREIPPGTTRPCAP